MAAPASASNAQVVPDTQPATETGDAPATTNTENGTKRKAAAPPNRDYDAEAIPLSEIGHIDIKCTRVQVSTDNDATSTAPVRIRLTYKGKAPLIGIRAPLHIPFGEQQHKFLSGTSTVAIGIDRGNDTRAIIAFQRRVVNAVKSTGADVVNYIDTDDDDMSMGPIRGHERFDSTLYTLINKNAVMCPNSVWGGILRVSAKYTKQCVYFNYTLVRTCAVNREVLRESCTITPTAAPAAAAAANDTTVSDDAAAADNENHTETKRPKKKKKTKKDGE